MGQLVEVFGMIFGMTPQNREAPLSAQLQNFATGSHPMAAQNFKRKADAIISMCPWPAPGRIAH